MSMHDTLTLWPLCTWIFAETFPASAFQPSMCVQLLRLVTTNHSVTVAPWLCCPTASPPLLSVILLQSGPSSDSWVLRSMTPNCHHGLDPRGVFLLCVLLNAAGQAPALLNPQLTLLHSCIHPGEQLYLPLVQSFQVSAGVRASKGVCFTPSRSSELQCPSSFFLQLMIWLLV